MAQEVLPDIRIEDGRIWCPLVGPNGDWRQD